MVDHQAGLPVLMPPRSGHRSDAPDCGQRLTAPRAPLPTTSGTTCLVAYRARERAEHRPKRAETRLQGSPRVPATWCAAPAVLAQADPPRMTPRTEGSRSRVGPSRSGRVAPRWVRIHAAPHQPPAPRA